MKTFIISTLIALSATASFAHGGGLNKWGCHHDYSSNGPHGHYHCHCEGR